MPYPVVLLALRQDEKERGAFGNGVEMLLELAAAYSLGEVELTVR